VVPAGGQNRAVTAPDQRPAGLWRSLVEDPKHGPLPILLLVITITTGVVDAVSLLSLGRVFVANMTGNVVFIGFALVGARGYSLAASLFALGGFLVGALGGGMALDRLRLNRLRLLRNAISVEFSLLVVALVVAVLSGSPLGRSAADAMAACMAVALGLQNSVARRLAVPDLTTTVLTMTLTGIAADVRQRDRATIGRRLLAVASMLVGAVAGALLVLHVSPAAGVGLAAALMGLMLLSTVVAARTPAPWHT
jgi:uncharacterized membrane protein YoaK (UPF0700 family)